MSKIERILRTAHSYSESVEVSTEDVGTLTIENIHVENVPSLLLRLQDILERVPTVTVEVEASSKGLGPFVSLKVELLTQDSRE